MTVIPFVDAHVHFWQLDELRYPWLSPPFSDGGPAGSVAPIAHDYVVRDYLADAGAWNVVGAVHVDAGADAAQALDETRWLEKLAEEQGYPTAIIGFARLDDPHVKSVLTAHAAYPRVRGIRQIVNWHSDPQRSYTPSDITRSPEWEAGYGLLAELGLSFDLQCYPGQMPGLMSLLERHPGVPVIVNHLGMPVMTDANGLDDWRTGLKALAKLRHVAIKLSGLGFIYRDWTFDRVRSFLQETVDLFGTDRCMVASDTPTDKLFAPFDRYLETYQRFAADFTDGEQRDLFGRNANRIYRLGLDI